MSPSPDPAELERVAALCDEHGIHTVECVLVDTWGIPRGKRLPVRQFLRGAGYAIANVLYTWDPRCGIFDTPFVEASDGFPDMHAVPDLASFRVAGWADGVGVVLCDTYAESGEPVPLDPRGMLKRVLDRFAGHGLAVQAATELEFHLMTADWEPLFSDVHCYSIAKGAELEPVLLDIRESLRRTGIEVEACNVEYGPAQVEINLRYGPALEMADATVLFKYVVRETARRHGMRATFMAKPYMGEAGNGMHVHQSLVRADGSNAFAETDGEPPLGSALMRRYLSGLMAHQKDLQAVTAPTVNGYKRVEDYSFSPTQVTWGLDHRLVGVRCIAGKGQASRLEARWAAADANPYLVLAGCLAAGLDGIEQDLPLPDMVVGDPHADDRWERLPTSLAGALANFEAAPFVKEAFGETFAQIYPHLVRHELDEFARHVTDWEKTRYRDVI